MAGKKTIIINGRLYDATTGLPVQGEAPQSVFKNKTTIPVSDSITARPMQDIARVPRSATPATQIHSKLERSHTLRRAALQKPASNHTTHHTRSRAHMTRSEHISKFAPSAQPSPQHPSTEPQPTAPHQPVLKRTYKNATHAAPPHTPISSRAIKEHLIHKELSKKPAKPAEEPERFFAKHPRTLSIVSAGLAVMLLGGYLTYINVPNLSVRVAASQAGINASLPEYRPDGYSFDGPPQYAQGQVTLKFASTTGPQGYTITQKASDWDSQAVLDNYVNKESAGAYNIHSVQGLTIYTFGNKAAWVSGGLLNEIDYGTAPLSYSQIEQIASSM
ncbi:MAG TPA: hypothetical protein VFZ48_05175 [Candidatus Saccharimonadales bacterium]